MTKFDVVIGNPPYKQGLHLKFLDIALDISKEYVVFLHPSAIYLNKQPTRKSNDTIKVKNKLKNHIKSIDIFESKKYFPEIGVIVPLSISFIDKKHTQETFTLYDSLKNKTFEYSDIDNIHLFGNSKEFLSLRKKINSEDNLINHKNEENGNYYVNIPMIRGGLEQGKYFSDAFYTFFTKNIKVESKGGNFFFSFPSKKEAENFIDYMKTKFARLCLALYKISFHQEGYEMLGIPWMNFKEEWTDKKLFNHFKLSIDEINFIEDNIPDYY